MKTYSRDLNKARRWLASGKSTKVIHYLEPKVPLFLEDPQYYALLGRAYLYNGSYGDADTYLSRGLQADPAHLEVRLTLAVNHLKRKDPASAVRTWLEIIDEYPGQKSARKGLKALRKISSQEQQDRFLDRFDIRRYLPRISSPWPGRIVILLVLALAGLLGMYFRDEITVFVSEVSSSRNSEVRPGSESLIPDRGTVLSAGRADAIYFLSDAEISRSLKKAVKEFQSYEDNSARRELNRIVLSNASDDVRAQATNLLALLGSSSIDALETSYTYGDVMSEPRLYQDCYVLWRGKTANVAMESDAIRFDYLVGFDEGTVLEGKLPVEVPFLVVMEPLPLELLARVDVREDGVHLVAETLHFLR